MNEYICSAVGYNGRVVCGVVGCADRLRAAALFMLRNWDDLGCMERVSVSVTPLGDVMRYRDIEFDVIGDHSVRLVGVLCYNSKG